MLRIRVILVGSLAALVGVVLLGCSSGTMDRSPTPVPSETRPDLVLVYAKRSSPDDERLAGHARTRVVAYDAVSGIEIAHAFIEQAVTPVLSRYGGEVVFVGNYKDGAEIRSLDPIAHTERIVHGSLTDASAAFAVSPDGRTLAIVQPSGDATRSEVMLIDVATGSAAVAASFERRKSPGTRGPLTVRGWRDDGRELVLSGDNGEDGGTWITLSLPGNITAVHPFALADLSPNGRFLFDDDVNEVGCILAAAPQVRLYDLDGDREVAYIDDPERAYVSHEWSPAGDAVLLTKYAVKADSPGSCLPDYDLSSPAYAVLSAAGATPVDDPAVLRARWHGDRLLEYRCAAGGQPVGPFSSQDCRSRGRQILLLNGHEIDRGEDIRVLGFVEDGSSQTTAP